LRGPNVKNKFSGSSSKKITQSWFGKWSNEYDKTLGKISFHRDLLDLIAKNSTVKDYHKVLDIGCGTGLLSLKLLQASNCSITGIDNSKEMLAIFQNKIKKLKLDKQVVCRYMDAASLNFNNDTFDIVVSSVTLHHLKEKLRPLRNIYRILKPGGTFIIGDADMDATGKHTDTKRFKRIIRVLEQEWIAALKDVGVEAFVRMFDNGKNHILNRGEYCISLKQWADTCRKAGFKTVRIKKVPRHKEFGIVISKK
jgi:ubiquinone/menaquinone biosynthesis C-methylase UbiE